MANLLSRFNKTVVGSDSKLADYKSRISSVGDFQRIEDVNVILNSWSNILTTPKRTYMFDPEYGSNLYKLVFEPADDRTREQIVQEVVSSIRAYDDRARIKDVTISFFPNMKGFNVAVDVEYDNESGQVSVAIDENTYFQFYESLDETES